MVDRLSPNALGSLYMTLGTLAYVVNDALIRLATEQGLDVYQALFLRGCAMVVILAALTKHRGEALDRRLFSGPLLARVAAEVVGTALFFAGLIQLEFANAQTILMLTPFVVTLVAARRLGERVSPLAWLIVAAGFAGVLAVVRPTPGEFSAWSLLVLAAALALAIREFATRRADPDISALPIALVTAVAITSMMGVISVFTGWGSITQRSLLYLAFAMVCLIAGYLFAIQTVRVGDLSATAPFRYTAVVFAVIVGLVFFDEAPDALTWIGCAVIVVAGIWSARLDASRQAGAAMATEAGLSVVEEPAAR